MTDAKVIDLRRARQERCAASPGGHLFIAVPGGLQCRHCDLKIANG